MSKKKSKTNVDIHGRMYDLLKSLDSSTDYHLLGKIDSILSRYESINAKKSYHKALAEFQGNLPLIKETGSGVTYFDMSEVPAAWSYATDKDIIEVIKKPLADNGFSYTFDQNVNEGNKITVICTITHKDGHSESSKMTSDPDISVSNVVIHQYLSTVTHLKRCTLKSVLGLYSVENDDISQLFENPQYAIPDTSFNTANDDGLNYLDENHFNDYIQTWEKLIISGQKTPEDIIKHFSENSEVMLTNDHINILKSKGVNIK